MATKCSHGDGSHGYSFTHSKGDYKSWVKDPDKVYNAMLDDAKKTHKDKYLDVSNVQVISLNSI